MNDIILAAACGFLFGVGCAATYIGWADTRVRRTPATLRAVSAPLSVPASTVCRPVPAPAPPGAPKDYELLIVDCKDAAMWYSGKVGKRVPFLSSDSEGYWSREDAGYRNVVRRDDARIVVKES